MTTIAQMTYPASLWVHKQIKFLKVVGVLWTRRRLYLAVFKSIVVIAMEGKKLKTVKAKLNYNCGRG